MRELELLSGLLLENPVRAPGALTREKCLLNFSGSGKSCPCPPREKGLLAEGRSCLSKLLQKYFQGSPGALTE